MWSGYGCGQGMGVVRCMHAHGWVKLLGISHLLYCALDLNLKMSNEGE